MTKDQKNHAALLLESYLNSFKVYDKNSFNKFVNEIIKTYGINELGKEYVTYLKSLEIDEAGEALKFELEKLRKGFWGAQK